MAKTQLTQTLLHSPYQPPARSGDGLVSCQEGFSIAVTDSSNRLVATLGSRSTLKKVTRKAILEVDVPKACETIQAPSAPMALRLQGNLLFGVSRVYSQQCDYVLADTQSFRDKMKGIMVVMKELEVDPDAGKARPDQLNIPDDPAFLPDFDMNLDLSTFEVSTSTSGFCSSMTPLSFPSGRSSLAIEPIQEAALVFPSAETPLAVDFSGFGFAGDTSSVLKTASRADPVSMFEDTGMIEDPGFEYDFDAKGNLVEYATRRERQRVSHSIADPASKTWIASAISGQIREEQETSLQGAKVRLGSSFDEANISLPEQLDQDMAFNDAPPFVCEDEDPPLREVPPFSPARRLTPTPAQPIPHSSSVRAEEEMTSSVEAPQRKAQAPKVTRPDSRQELANADLAQWNTNYLTNMAEATKIKQKHKAGVLAKKNATFWVLGQGIAGVGIRLADHRVPNPLEMYCGQALLTTLTGREVSPAGTKRIRTFSVDLDERGEARRVRARGEGERQVWRGDTGRNDRESLLLREDGVMFPGDDMDIEMGRHAPESLHGDHSSQMPWNVSVPRHNSARQFGIGLPVGVSSNISGRGPGIEFGPAPALIARRGSRLTSASPLLGKGGTVPRYSSLGLPEQPKAASGEVGWGDIFDNGRAQAGDHDLVDDLEFQLYGPAAAVDTQTAAQSQWIAATLDTEANNFLAFLRAEIDAKIVAAERASGQLEEQHMETVTFEELLPPEQHSKVVAAQGLLHVLSLATKGLIKVRQEQAFERIEISTMAAEGNEDGGQDMEV